MSIVDIYTWTVPCVVKRRKDADTFVVVAQVPGTINIPMLDLHADMTFPQELVLRLEGVNAPEKRAPGGAEAIAFVDAWLAMRIGNPLYLATNNRKDSFGRTLGDLRESPSYLTGLAYDLLQAQQAVPFMMHGEW